MKLEGRLPIGQAIEEVASPYRKGIEAAAPSMLGSEIAACCNNFSKLSETTCRLLMIYETAVVLCSQFQY